MNRIDAAPSSPVPAPQTGQVWRWETEIDGEPWRFTSMVTSFAEPLTGADGRFLVHLSDAPEMDGDIWSTEWASWVRDARACLLSGPGAPWGGP
jgi:hypothetical protein